MLVQVSFFLGAGASAPYGMPTAGKFIELLQSRGRNRHMWREVVEVLGASSIESLFDGLGDTAGYFSTGAGKSVRSWLLKSAPGSPTQWMRDVPGLEADLRGRIFEAYGWNPEMGAVLGAVLEPLLDLAAGQKEIPVYTTNYDRCVEEYCSDPDRGLLCRDGFQADSFAGRFRWSDTYGPAGEEGGLSAPRTLKLHKLHGSLGWKLGPYGPERLAYESRSDSSHCRDLLAYPSSRTNPLMENALFRTILSEFKKSLLSSDACIVIGYSFRDSDIADAFEEFVRGDRILVAVGDGAVPDICKNVLRVPVPEGADRRWRRAGPGRAVCIDPSLPNVYGVNELVSPETIPGITRCIAGILHGDGGAACAGPWTSAACASAADGHGGAPPRGGATDAPWQPLVAGPGRP